MSALRSRALAAIAATAGLVCLPASAAELGLYVGFLYGDSSKDFDTGVFSSLASIVYQDLAFTPDLRSFTTSADGKSYGFLAGYRLTQHFAIEGAYMQFGKQGYRESASGFLFPDEGDPMPEDWTLSLTSRTKGFMLSALGVLSISYSWEVYARAGALIATNELSLYANSPVLSGAIADRFQESSTDWLAGIGISMSLAEVYALRAEYTRIFDAGDPLFGEGDTDMVSIGITVSF